MKNEVNEVGEGFTKVVVKQVGVGEANVLSLNADIHTTTVQALKERIEKQLDIPVERQRLIGWGRMLENSMFLHEMPGCKGEDGKIVAPAVQYVHLTPLPRGKKLSVRSSKELFPERRSRNRPIGATTTSTSNPVASLPNLASTSTELERARRLGLRHLHRRRRREEPYSLGNYYGHQATTTSTAAGGGPASTNMSPSRVNSTRRNVEVAEPSTLTSTTADLLAAVNNFAEFSRNNNNDTNPNVLDPVLSVAAATSLLPPGTLEAALSAGCQWPVPGPAPPPPVPSTPPASLPALVTTTTIPPQQPWSSTERNNVMAMNPTSNNMATDNRTPGQELHPLALLAESLGVREPPPPAPAPPLPPPVYAQNDGNSTTLPSDATALTSLLLPYLLGPTATTADNSNNNNSALAASLLTQSLLLDPTLLHRLYSNAAPP
eukprot:Nitzschia sp. Nitz4//scaffold319_size20443//18359//19660//NITZ4_008674-RA/size20443-processed-gene-0.10-mRNA-1//1//CDS//3329547589//6804//frame0